AAPAEHTVETAAAPQPPVNEEVLAIYLDEAGEVLATIDATLPRCREQPHDRAALTAIRRGFHTLKGSGRMVGLMELGEVAWQIEQVTNQYLEQQRPATPGLLELITLASTSFAAWVAQIRSGKPVAIDARHITQLAQRLKSSEDTAAIAAEAPATDAVAPGAAQQPIAPAPAVPAAELAEVTIGGTRLTRGFYEVYSGEAAQHVATLEAEYAGWCNSPVAEASHELLRAAHTLASSSRTAGFTAIADLAGAVEHWTPVAPLISDVRDVDAVREAIEKLREMVDAVARGEPPAQAEEALRCLRDSTARLQAQSARLEPPESRPEEVADTVTDSPAARVPVSVPAAVPEVKEQRKIRDDLDAQLLPIFLEEARELLPLIGSDLREWKASPFDQKIPQSLMRTLHTLKGSARMAGAIRLGELTHLMESRIEAAVNSDLHPPELFEDLESKMDRLSVDLERMQADQAALAYRPAEGVAASGGEVPHEAAPRDEPPLQSPAALLRINADTLDHLINASGEVSIARSRIEAELRVVRQSLADLNDSITRLRGQLREVEIQADSQLQSRAAMLDERSRDFDPLEFDRYTRLQELTRLMGESLHDATSIQQALLKNLGESDSALLQQARTSRDVQQELMRMRAVPFATLNERLYRVVRQVARELGKKAELEIEDSQVEIDRGVLDRVGAPLEHMLRNALVHGLEAPAARSAAGKPETGRITVILRQESNEMAVIVSDDGAGLDLETLHRKALDKGILRHYQAETEAELVQLIFAGLSTAEELTELSGRGVGMDVVRNEISSLGGRIDVATVRGKGTTFTIYLPLTLAVTQAVLVRGGGSVLAISSAMVEQVLRFKADAMAGLYEKKVVESQDRPYPLHTLQHLLGAIAATEIQNYNSVLLLRSGAQRIALHVDELLGNQEIVVKHIGPQLARAPGVVGATVLADGRIAPIVNPVLLAQRSTRTAPLTTALPAMAPTRSAAPVVMVVDDSLTVRKVTGRLLEREGYRVLTAKDGVDALEQMKDTLPDIMLVDIEMPRMDGFDLAKIVRRDPRTQRLPIIIISSRTAEKHRSLAAELGVNAFLGKPFQESDLLEQVSRHLTAGKRPASHH
ncbi:MAG: Hpt domain-containing protein, partial [Burkholderiales bacterium]